MEVSPTSLAPEIRTRDDLVRTFHTAVFGTTGSGKTMFTKRLYKDTTMRAVYWNPEHEPVGGRVVPAKQVSRALGSGIGSLDVRPPDSQDEREKQFLTVKQQLMAVGDRLRGGKEKTDPWVLVVVDEAHLVAGKHDSYGPVHDLLSRGRKRGIRVVVASQRPARVPHEVMTQARIHFIYETQWEDEYFRRYKVPVDQFQDWVSKPYHFVGVRGARWARFRPVPRV